VKARRRTPITLILVAALTGALFTAYLHFGVLPGDLRTYALGKISQLTGKHVTFDKTLFLPFQGLSFTNLKVTDASGNVLFAARKLRLDAEIVTFFREKKIVITRAYLEGPVLTTVLSPVRPKTGKPPVIMTKLSGQIPIPVVPEGGPDVRALEDGPDALLPENVYLRELEVLDGRLRVLSPDGKLIEDVRDINVLLRFQKPPVLLFDGSVKLGANPYAALFLKGGWNLDTAAYEFRLRSKSTAVPVWLGNYQQKNFLILKDGHSTLNIQLKSAPDGEAFFHAESNLHEARLTAHEAIYSGQMALSVDGSFSFEQRRLTRYKGTLDFVDVAVSGLPASMPPLENLSGALNFQPDLLELRALRGQYKQLVFSADGTLRSFKDLNLDANVRVSAPLADLVPFLPPAERAQLNDLVLEGQCQTATSFTGSFRNIERLKARHSLTLREGAVRDSGKNWEATDLSADLLSDDGGLRVSHARFTLAKKRYSLAATVPKDPGQAGKIDLRGDNFRLWTDYTKRGDAYAVSGARLAATGLDAQFDGTITQPGKPVLNLRGNASLDFARARGLVSQYFPALKDAALAGTLSGKFLLKGPAGAPLDWDFQMDAAGDPVFIKEKVRLDGFEVQIRYKNRALNLPYFRARAYGGALGGRAFFDLTKPDPTFNAKFYANTIDLAGITRDLDLKSDELTGTVLLDANLKGLVKDRRTWTGGGTADVKNGTLWKTDLFKQMGDLPFVKVIGLDQVVFTGLHAPFTVRDAKIWSEDLRLHSETVGLRLKGNVSFEGVLDFVMSIGYTDNVITGALDTGGIVPFVIEKASGMISEYKVSGTLKKPKSEKILFPGLQAAAQ